MSVEERVNAIAASITFERDGDWWVGQAVELPAAMSQGTTLDECRENVRWAIEDVLDFLADEERDNSCRDPR